MLKALLFAGALALALATAACDASNTTPKSTTAAPPVPTHSAATGDIAVALAVGCPILASVQSSSLVLDANEKGAVTTLELFCPPNPPPTHGVVAVGDLVAAYSILAPLLK